MFDFSSEFEALAEAYSESGGEVQDLKNDTHGLMLVSGNEVLGTNEIEGLQMQSESIPDGIRAKVTVEKGHHLQNPVHLCFGVLPEEGVQKIEVEFDIQDDATASFLAHCTFPKAVKVQHIMHGVARIGKKAHMQYHETHYHGASGGVEVLPDIKVYVDEGGRYSTTFKLVKGAAGRVDIKYDAWLQKDAVAEMFAKVYGKGADDIKIKESIYLDGENSRGLAESRIVVTEKAQAEVLGEIVGTGVNSRGHVDCTEIVQGKTAVASAVPMLKVVDETSHLTHEAAIGSVDKKQMQTLMARGLDEQQATDKIVGGLLR